MAKKHHKTTKILSYKQYLTFQGYYKVNPSMESGMTNEDAYNKCILYVMKWMRDRLEEALGQEEEFSFMDSYPAPDEYKNFMLYLDGKDTVVQGKKGSYDIGILAVKNEKTWTLRILEPNNDAENAIEKHPERIFITDIAIKNTDQGAKVAVRLTCKEPSNNVKDAAAFRPAFLYYIYEDSDLLMTEGDIETSVYAINGEALILNVRSGLECKKICDSLIKSEHRQLPVVFCPNETEEQKNDDKWNEAKSRLVGGTAGLAYVIEENYNKNYANFFMEYNKEKVEEYIKKIKTSFLCIDPLLEGDEHWFEADFDGLNELDAYLHSYTVRKDGAEGKKGYGYGDILFHSSLWNKYVQYMEEASDKELFEEIKEKLRRAEERNESLSAEEKQKNKEEIEKLIRELEQSQNKMKELKAQNKENQKTITEHQKDNVRLREELREKDDRIEKLRKYEPTEEILRLKREKEENRQRAKGYFEPYYKAGTEKKEKVIPWIEEQFSNNIIIHPDAEKAFDKFYNSSMPLEKICGAFILLNAYAMKKNRQMEEAVFNIIETDPKMSALKIERSGFEKDKAPAAAFIDYRGVTRILDWHLTYSAQTENIIRIYFLYDKEDEKIVVGSMPDHLAQTKDGDAYGNRTAKA